ncbi:MAG TPA: HAMP domain-containing sensor histidine kinase, partial [Chitinophagaceae bacterium]|nr:HAMP domain-containing sensor histidine kinase [Chitinophagaceae bacterium]
MKRIFPVIIILISLSLIGIILIQISWLNNMLLLREDQIKQRIFDATRIVGDELAQHKAVPGPSKPFQGLTEDFSMELAKPYNVGHRFTTQEIYDKIRLVFGSQKLEDVPFEFGLAVLNSGEIGYMERKSNRFAEWYNDTTNHLRYYHFLVPPSGSAAENLAADEMLIIVVPEIKNIVFKNLQPRIVIAILFTIVIVTAFYLTIHTMLRQKKLSEIKNDFINNMTHEFKTPIATISLAVDALRNEKVMQDPKKMTYFSTIIKEENQRMNRQVETILKSALMDRQEVQLQLKPIQAHKIIQDVADNFMLRLQEKQGTLELQLNATEDTIEADEVHFSNLVNNLMDNAVKYSKDNVPPKICLAT